MEKNAENYSNINMFSSKIYICSNKPITTIQKFRCTLTNLNTADEVTRIDGSQLQILPNRFFYIFDKAIIVFRECAVIKIPSLFSLDFFRWNEVPISKLNPPSIQHFRTGNALGHWSPDQCNIWAVPHRYCLSVVLHFIPSI